jgi:hypothetical protein
MLRFYGVALFFLLCNFARPSLAHKFPDGYVDRTIAVLVRNRHVEIEYSIGMNDRTMGRLIEDWQSSEMTSKALFSEENRIGNDKSTIPFEKDSASTMPRLADIELLSEDSLPEFTSNDPKVFDAFEKLASERLIAGFQIVKDGRVLKMPDRWEKLPTKRHMSLTLKLEFELPEKKTNDLVIEDKNFHTLAGGIRKSIKAKGNSILAKSNAAPIIVRAQRVERADVDASQWHDANTLRALIVQVGTGSK